MAWNKSRAAHDTTSVLSGTRVSVWHSSLSPSGNNSAFEFVLATTVDCCGHKMRRMVKRFIPQNARGGEEVVGAGRARPSPAPGVLTGSRGGSKTRTGMNKNANDGQWSVAHLRRLGTWVGNAFPAFTGWAKVVPHLRRSGGRGRGSACLDTIRAGFCAGAYDVVLREPTPSPEFSTERAAARCAFFLALPWVRNVECALGLGGFLGAAPIYSNGVAGGRRHKPARRGGGRSL